MKSKALLPLMEQLIMILVFALAAALCLQGFSLASRTSASMERRNHAAVIAQNTAELLKSSKGDYEKTYEQVYKRFATSSDGITYEVIITPVEDNQAYLETAIIQVRDTHEVLFEITTAWQEEN